jgi:hypothetical protein
MNMVRPWRPSLGLGRFFFTVGAMTAVHAAFGTTPMALVDLETVPFALFSSGFAAPSIVLYAVLITCRANHARQAATIFLASLMPLSVYLAYASMFAPEGKGLAALMLGIYALPAVLALAADVLLISRN